MPQSKHSQPESHCWRVLSLETSPSDHVPWPPKSLAFWRRGHRALNLAWALYIYAKHICKTKKTKQHYGRLQVKSCTPIIRMINLIKLIQCNCQFFTYQSQLTLQGKSHAPILASPNLKHFQSDLVFHNQLASFQLWQKQDAFDCCKLPLKDAEEDKEKIPFSRAVCGHNVPFDVCRPSRSSHNYFIYNVQPNSLIA